MPSWVVAKTREALGLQGRSLDGARVLLLGIAYKPDVDDDRESPGYVLWKLLENSGARVDYSDPHVGVIRPSREHREFAGRSSVELTATAIGIYDCVLLATHHRAYDYPLIARHARLIVDTRNAFSGIPLPAGRLVKA